MTAEYAVLEVSFGQKNPYVAVRVLLDDVVIGCAGKSQTYRFA